MGNGPLNTGVMLRDPDIPSRIAVVNADGSIDVTIVGGGGSGGTSMTDDSAFTPGVTGVTPIAGFADEITPDSVEEGDAGAVRMSLNRNLYVQLRDSSGAERGQRVSAEFAGLVAGDVPSDVADAGNPVKVGFEADATLSTATLVADGDRVNGKADLDGAQVVRLDGTLGDTDSGVASNTDGSSTQVLAAPGAGVKYYIQAYSFVNTSATDTYVEIKSSGTVVWRASVPANGGCHLSGLKIECGANEAINFDPADPVTTMYASITAVRSKV